MLDSAILERTFPHNLEAERALLGSILLDNSALNVAAEVLRPTDFFAEAHRITYEAMLALTEKGRAAELVTLSEELSNQGLLEKAGGASYLAALTDGVPLGTVASVSEYTRIVKEKALIRSLINVSQNIISRCMGAMDDAETLIDEAQSQILEVAEKHVRPGFHHVKDVIPEVLARLENPVSAVETGFERLDAMTSGFQPGDLIIIAARPSLGKTTLALNLAAHAAINQQKTVVIFSLEMSKESLVMRLLCSEGRIDSHTLRAGLANVDHWQKLMRATARLAPAHLLIDDMAAPSVMQIRAKARRLKAEQRLDMVIVDYLQLMSGHGRFENRTQEVSYISRGLKSIAKELNVPVVALSQLSRAVEVRKGGEPQLSDLRDSGSIEQDADVVIFIHRAPIDGTGADQPGVVTELNIGKQRNGPTGPFKLVFIKPWARFENYTPEDAEI